MECPYQSLRTRKLLLHKQEIRKIEMKLKTKGLTLVPLKMYFKHGKVKVEIGTATGKKLYDKRQDMAEKAAKRDLDRRIKTLRLPERGAFGRKRSQSWGRL